MEHIGRLAASEIKIKDSVEAMFDDNSDDDSDTHNDNHNTGGDTGHVDDGTQCLCPRTNTATASLHPQMVL